jgi:hypothetical protein
MLVPPSLRMSHGFRSSRPPFGDACRTRARAGGGIVGSNVGVRRLGEVTLRRALGVVLVIAGVRLMLTRR